MVGPPCRMSFEIDGGPKIYFFKFKLIVVIKNLPFQFLTPGAPNIKEFVS